MNKSKLGLIALLGLTGCAGNQIKKTNAMYFAECGYEDHGLDPIRDKMVFIFSGDPKEMTKEMLNNNEFISESEKPALQLFLKKRDYCNRYEYNYLLLANKKAMEDLYHLLYTGKITYGELAHYRIDIARLALSAQYAEQQMMKSKLLMGCQEKK